MERLPLTVLIPCKNERRNLPACIASVRALADEVLIADSGSTDGTLELVRRLGGCRIIEREYVHSGDFKNWAIPQASSPWVLVLDADERVPPALAHEIDQVLAGTPDHEGYWIGRQNYFLGHKIRFSGWQTDKVLRLFRRDAGRYIGETDHAEISIASGRVGWLKERLEHFAFRSYDEYFRKFDRYTSYQAHVWYRQGRRPSGLRLLTTGTLRFLHTYVIRLGILDGLAGLQVCMLTGFSSFMKQARLWELWHRLPESDLLPEGPPRGLAGAGTIRGATAVESPAVDAPPASGTAARTVERPARRRAG